MRRPSPPTSLEAPQLILCDVDDNWLPAGGRLPMVDVVSPGTACPTTSSDSPEDSCSHSREGGGAC